MALVPLVSALNKPEGAKAIRPIVEATRAADDQGGPPPPYIPPAAAALHNALTYTLSFKAEALATPPGAKWAGVALLRPQVTGAGADVPLLLAYWDSPVRNRLRQCPVCARWFLDATRSKHARRCSRKCTIAWTNAQRPKKGTTR